MLFRLSIVYCVGVLLCSALWLIEAISSRIARRVITGTWRKYDA